MVALSQSELVYYMKVQANRFIMMYEIIKKPFHRLKRHYQGSNLGSENITRYDDLIRMFKISSDNHYTIAPRATMSFSGS